MCELPQTIMPSLQQIGNQIPCKQCIEPHIRRPMNSFMIWAKENRSCVKNENPLLNNANISVLLGQKWRTLPEDKVFEFIDKARKEKQLLKQKYPLYKYTPQGRNTSGKNSKPKHLKAGRPRIKAQKAITIPKLPNLPINSLIEKKLDIAELMLDDKFMLDDNFMLDNYDLFNEHNEYNYYLDALHYVNNFDI